MEQTEPKVTFHWTRVRAKGDSDFYDPQTDIRVLMPEITNVCLDVLMEAVRDGKLKEDFRYLSKCYSIYQIRLVEDSTPMAKQVNEFNAAVARVSPVALFLWQQAFMNLMNAVYAMFARRDAKTDGASIRNILNTAKLTALTSVVDAATADEIYTKYKMRGDIVEEQCVIDPKGKAVCEETKQVIDDVKHIARIFINHTGSDEWEDLAEECDKFLSSQESDDLPDNQKVAIALAYPSYKKPYLTVEADDA